MSKIKKFRAFLESASSYNFRWYADQINDYAQEELGATGHKKSVDEARGMGLSLDDLWQSFTDHNDGDAFYELTSNMPIAESVDDVISPGAFFQDGNDWFFGVTEGYDYYRYIYGLDGSPEDL